jgi:hypothetical protein
MYETILKTLHDIATDADVTTLTFKVAVDVYLVFDIREEELFWTDAEGNATTVASVQSVQTVLGSQFGQSSI